MKRVHKPITSKKDTVNDIKTGKIDTKAFIDRINDYVSNANYLLNTKIDKMDPLELMEALEEVFNIYFNEKDYLRMLSLKNRKHYLQFILIETNMYDDEGNNISYLGAITSKVICPSDSIFDLKALRKLTNSGDIQLIKQFTTGKKQINKREPFEQFVFDEIDIDSGIVDKDSELYPYAAIVLKKETITKYVIFDLKQYIDEVQHQAREIISLQKSNDVEMASIGKQYKLSYDGAINDGTISKQEKISVRYHQKTNKKNKGRKK